MLVEDQDGQKMVVVNPGPGEEPQTIVIPEQVMINLLAVDQVGNANLICLLQFFNALFQAETVYVIASRVSCCYFLNSAKLLYRAKVCATIIPIVKFYRTAQKR